jgi:hypothetical protein
LPASHLKVHAATEKGLADELSVLVFYFCSFDILFLQLHGLSYNLQGIVARGAKISAAKHKKCRKNWKNLELNF